MDTNDSAAGGPPEDDVFGPVEDGEEVFEWIDDHDDPDQGADPADKAPAPTFRERLASARAAGGRLREKRRQIAVATAVVVVACGAGGGGTAWFDGVAGAADRADVVALGLDSVVDGDPAAGSYDSANSSAVSQYVLDIANNSPDAVTLGSVDVDSGTMMTSTAWKPLGSARIAAGGTAKVMLTVKMFCPMVTLGEPTGQFGGSIPGDTGGGEISLTFPSVHVTVRDADGSPHQLLLPTRVLNSAQLAQGQPAFRGPSGQAVPEIVSADIGACGQYVADRDSGSSVNIPVPARFPSAVDFAYAGMTSATDKSFVLNFTVKNTSANSVVVGPRTDPLPVDDSRLTTEWRPTRLTLAPGQSAAAQLAVHILGCTSILTGSSVLGETMLQVESPATGSIQPGFIDQALTGSLRLAADVVRQEKAACS